MKKLNKKGFTLVELLVVIVILVIIMSIAIPSITSSLDRSKAKQRDAKVKLIESAAEIYADRHIGTTTVSTTKVSVSDLYNEGLITIEQLKDPFNDENCIIEDVTCTGTSCKMEATGDDIETGDCPS